MNLIHLLFKGFPYRSEFHINLKINTCKISEITLTFSDFISSYIRSNYQSLIITMKLQKEYKRVLDKEEKNK